MLSIWTRLKFFSGKALTLSQTTKILSWTKLLVCRQQTIAIMMCSLNDRTENTGGEKENAGN